MKRLLLTLPLVVLAACTGDTTTTLTSPSESSAWRSNVGPMASNTVVVSPTNMRGWAFYDDNTNGPCLVAADCRMVSGPGTPPRGTGSAELAATLATARNYLGLPHTYNGMPFSLVTALSYWTYRQTPAAPNPLAIALQFNVDYNLTTPTAVWQGRVVYEPYLTGATVASNTWQQWNTLTGRGWWSSSTAAALAANPTATPCTMAAPCTWAELVAKYPRAGVHKTLGAVLLKAGGGWTGFRGNTDALTIGLHGFSTTYDFELKPTTHPHDHHPSGNR